jgi:hypothetical protein
VNQNFILCPPSGAKPQINRKDLWQTTDHWENRFVHFNCLSCVWEQTGGEKLVGLLFPWPPIVEFFSPRSRLYKLKSGVGILEINPKY